MIPTRTGTFAVVNAFKANTGSSSVARAYFHALQAQDRPVTWYQCISSKDRESYDHLGVDIGGYAGSRDDLNLVANSLLVFPRKIGKLTEGTAILTDPVLLGAAARLPRSIVVVHDLRELVEHRRSLLAGAYFGWLFRRLDSVEHILCDSDATRTELRRFYHPTPPVDVVHPSSGILGKPAEHIELSLQRAFQNRSLNLLCVAVDRPYKNISLFYRLAKLLEVPRDGWTFRFRLVSRLGPQSRREIARIQASNLEVIPSVPDVTLAYEQADVLVHPSLLEGFGLPPVEAMQFGIPILASAVPCLREVIDTGGVLIDPQNLERWVSAVLELRDPAVFRSRALSSAARGEQFTQSAFQRRLSAWMQARSY